MVEAGYVGAENWKLTDILSGEIITLIYHISYLICKGENQMKHVTKRILMVITVLVVMLACAMPTSVNAEEGSLQESAVEFQKVGKKICVSPEVEFVNLLNYCDIKEKDTIITWQCSKNANFCPYIFYNDGSMFVNIDNYSVAYKLNMSEVRSIELQPRGLGKTTVTAKVQNGKTYKWYFYVTESDWGEIKLNTSGNFKMEYSNKSISGLSSGKWKSSDPKVIRVSSDGSYKALKKGKADLILKTSEMTYTMHVSVVKELTEEKEFREQEAHTTKKGASKKIISRDAKFWYKDDLKKQEDSILFGLKDLTGDKIPELITYEPDVDRYDIYTYSYNKIFDKYEIYQIIYGNSIYVSKNKNVVTFVSLYKSCGDFFGRFDVEALMRVKYANDGTKIENPKEYHLLKHDILNNTYIRGRILDGHTKTTKQYYEKYKKQWLSEGERIKQPKYTNTQQNRKKYLQ